MYQVFWAPKQDLHVCLPPRHLRAQTLTSRSQCIRISVWGGDSGQGWKFTMWAFQVILGFWSTQGGSVCSPSTQPTSESWASRTMLFASKSWKSREGKLASWVWLQNSHNQPFPHKHGPSWLLEPQNSTMDIHSLGLRLWYLKYQVICGRELE